MLLDGKNILGGGAAFEFTTDKTQGTIPGLVRGLQFMQRMNQGVTAGE